MPKEENIPFQAIIENIYDPVFKDYGFEIHGEPEWSGNGEYKITAKKDNMKLIFYLGISHLFYYCDVGIKLSNELQEKINNETGKGSLTVNTIATCLDAEFTLSKKASQTKEEIIEKFNSHKETLLKYCQGILSGDLSDWVKVVNCLKEKGESS